MAHCASARDIVSFNSSVASEPKSSLILDAGYTAGYADTSGSRSHIFSRFYKSFIEKENETSDLEINLQHVSNSSYPKLNKLFYV